MMLTATLTNIASNLPPIAGGYGGLALTGLQILSTPSNYVTAKDADNGLQYSKFVHALTPTMEKEETATISSRAGMTIIYTPALIVSLSLYFLPMVSSNLPILPQQNLAEIFLAIHFAKRQLEVSFLHKYSGNMARATAIAIGTFYALNSLMISCVAFPFVDVGANTTTIGTILFATGIMGNFYHHYLLAKLRDDKKTDGAKYVAPRGGMFEYVAAPHYLFELIGWLGIAVVSQQMNAYLVFAGMTSYLSGRAALQNDWNRSKFSRQDWPESRRNIVPYLF